MEDAAGPAGTVENAPAEDTDAPRQTAEGSKSAPASRILFPIPPTLWDK